MLSFSHNSHIFCVWSTGHGGAKPIDFEREVDLKVIAAGDFNEAKSLEAFCINILPSVTDSFELKDKYLLQKGSNMIIHKSTLYFRFN